MTSSDKARVVLNQHNHHHRQWKYQNDRRGKQKGTHLTDKQISLVLFASGEWFDHPIHFLTQFIETIVETLDHLARIWLCAYYVHHCLSTTTTQITVGCSHKPLVHNRWRTRVNQLAADCGNLANYSLVLFTSIIS